MVRLFNEALSESSSRQYAVRPRTCVSVASSYFVSARHFGTRQ